MQEYTASTPLCRNLGLVPTNIWGSHCPNGQRAQDFLANDPGVA